MKYFILSKEKNLLNGNKGVIITSDYRDQLLLKMYSFLQSKEEFTLSYLILSYKFGDFIQLHAMKL